MHTFTEQAQLEDELARLRPGDLVMESGQFRDQVLRRRGGPRCGAR